jgi:hypothetical protein
MEVDDTRVRYTLPFGWIGLVLARWSSTTGCFAGIGGLDTLSVGNVLGRVLSRILGFGANGFPSFRCLSCFYSSTRTYSMIQTASRPRIIGNGKVDHHGVGTARAALQKKNRLLFSSLSSGGALHSLALHGLASRLSSLTDSRLDHGTGNWASSQGP